TKFLSCDTPQPTRSRLLPYTARLMLQMRAADNIYARRRAMSPRFAHLAPAAGESWEKSGGVLAAEKRNSDIFTQQAQSGTRG
ncbi:unnamed protein product, partial [Ascophyllum nodosum]